MTYRLFSTVVIIFLLSGGLLMASGQTESAYSPTAPTTWTVVAGSETVMEQTEHGMMGAWQYARFYPDALTVDVGDTVVFKFTTTMTHDVVFVASGQPPATQFIPENGDTTRMRLNPLAAAPTGAGTYDGASPVSSGPVAAMPDTPKEFAVTFTKEGTWKYVCTPHSVVVPFAGAVGMVGKIVVRKAGSSLPRTPDQIAESADAAIKADAAAAQAADANARKITSRPGASGATIYTMNAGSVTPSGGEFLRFGASDLTIKVGDTVEWVQKAAHAPHTISFFSGGTETPETIKEDGTTYRNAAAMAPAGGNSYDGTGIVSSGFLWGAQDPTPGPRKFSLTFTKSGRFEYICIPHDEMGMMAHITVQE